MASDIAQELAILPVLDTEEVVDGVDIECAIAYTKK